MSLSRSFDANYFLKNSPSPLSIVDLNLIYLDVSDTWSDFYGFNVEEVIGKKIFDVFPNIDKTWEKVYKECLQGEKIIKDDSMVINDKIHLIQRKIMPWRDSQDNIGGLVIIVDDMTDKMNLEQKLRQSDEKFKTSFYHSAVGMALLSNDGNWLQVNAQLCKLLGYTEEELLKKTFHEITHPDDLAYCMEKGMEHYLNRTDHYDMEKRYVHKNGNTLWVYIAITMIKDDKGCPLHFLLQVIDRTESKHTEKVMKDLNEQLIRRADELALSNKCLEEYAFVASHDLQEPLRMISNFLQLLKRKYESLFDDTAKQYVEYSIDGAMRMQEMINGLLEYSTVGTNEKVMEKADMNEIMKNAVELNKFIIDKRNATVTYGSLPVVQGVPSILLQLLLNLISNGLKYQKDGSNPKLMLTCTELAGAWQFCFSDNGIGMDPRNSEIIFTLFKRLHLKKDYSGSGIGLAICKRIVEFHKGTIWVESEPEIGSKFYFTIAKSIA